MNTQGKSETGLLDANRQQAVNTGQAAEQAAGSATQPPAYTKALVDGILQGVKGFVERSLRQFAALKVQPLSERLDAALERIDLLEQEIQAVGDKAIGPFLGPFNAQVNYQKGNVIVWDGSMWCAQKSCTGLSPKDNRDVWTMCCRKGDRGEDARIRNGGDSR